MIIDCYGFTYKSEFFQRQKKHLAESITNAGITYSRFSTMDIGPIHMIDDTTSANPKMRWAYGSWEDRENLTYTADLNTPLDVDVEE